MSIDTDHAVWQFSVEKKRAGGEFSPAPAGLEAIKPASLDVRFDFHTSVLLMD